MSLGISWCGVVVMCSRGACSICRAETKWIAYLRHHLCHDLLCVLTGYLLLHADSLNIRPSGRSTSRSSYNYRAGNTYGWAKHDTRWSKGPTYADTRVRVRACFRFSRGNRAYRSTDSIPQQQRVVPDSFDSFQVLHLRSSRRLARLFPHQHFICCIVTAFLHFRHCSTQDAKISHLRKTGIAGQGIEH